VLDSRDEILPAGATWSPATVTAPVVGYATYSAEVADGCSWANGVIARFTADVVEELVNDLAIFAAASMPGEHPTLGWQDSTVIVSWEHDDGASTTLVEIDRTRPDADGRYPIGAYLWPWQYA
ncbi:MAG: hypothetical protein L0Y54_20850, partial [Sporichthyaceae bacterium]|nr:hypothetical protein [Sporichthyaceae bacterium]